MSNDSTQPEKIRVGWRHVAKVLLEGIGELFERTVTLAAVMSMMSGLLFLFIAFVSGAVEIFAFLKHGAFMGITAADVYGWRLERPKALASGWIGVDRIVNWLLFDLHAVASFLLVALTTLVLVPVILVLVLAVIVRL